MTIGLDAVVGLYAFVDEEAWKKWAENPCDKRLSKKIGRLFCVLSTATVSILISSVVVEKFIFTPLMYFCSSFFLFSLNCRFGILTILAEKARNQYLGNYIKEDQTLFISAASVLFFIASIFYTTNGELLNAVGALSLCAVFTHTRWIAENRVEFAYQMRSVFAWKWPDLLNRTIPEAWWIEDSLKDRDC